MTFPPHYPDGAHCMCTSPNLYFKDLIPNITSSSVKPFLLFEEWINVFKTSNAKLFSPLLLCFGIPQLSASVGQVVSAGGPMNLDTSRAIILLKSMCFANCLFLIVFYTSIWLYWCICIIQNWGVISQRRTISTMYEWKGIVSSWEGRGLF